MRQNIINKAIRAVLLDHGFMPVKPVNQLPENTESRQILKDGACGSLYLITVRPLKSYKKIYVNETEQIAAIEKW